MKSTIQLAVFTTVLILTSIAAKCQQQSGECQFNTQDPACHTDQHNYTGQQPSVTPDQLDQQMRDYEKAEQRQHEECTRQSEQVYQECVRSGQTYCSLPPCR
jgi:hypothetical protein